MAKSTTPRSKNKRETKAPAKAAASANVRADSKSAAIIALLRRKGGTSLEEMMSATGWQKHSVRGFIAGALKKRHGFTATSEKTDDGRVYRVAADAQQ